MELGRTRIKDQFTKEVWYWQGTDQYDGWSVLGDEAMMVPHPYGADFAIEPFDAHGGWIASARDLACLGAAVDGQPVDNGARTVLQPKTLRRMLTPSSFPLNNAAFRAAGVVVTPSRHLWSHTGGMSGTSAFLISYKSDVVLAAVFNRLPSQGRVEFYDHVDALLNSLARELH
jgi:CubicO group peptidase (beta-lactamase class C family)